MSAVKDKFLLGAHMSIKGGIEQAIYRGNSIGCTSIQIFTHSNRQWNFKNINEEDRRKFFTAKKEVGLDSVIAHASYLINLASQSQDTLKKSLNTLEQELINCDLLAINYLILHPGSSSKNENDSLNQIISCINEIFDKKNSSTTILLENMAGQGSSVAYKFEQLATIYSGIKNKKRIGFCFDTCHAWAAGYDYSTEYKYQKMWQEFDSMLGIKNLKAIHLNDSKRKCGTKIDRHEDIGKGTIGLEAFRLLMNDKRFFTIPKLLETPQKELDNYKRNMILLINLLEKEIKEQFFNT